MLIKKIGPLPKGHSAVGKVCPACRNRIEAGQTITWMPLGPGDDPEARANAAANKPYKAAVAELHWECSATAYGRIH